MKLGIQFHRDWAVPVRPLDLSIHRFLCYLIGMETEREKILETTQTLLAAATRIRDGELEVVTTLPSATHIGVFTS